MSLGSRIGRIEAAASPPARLVRIDAKDEADYSEQRFSALLANIKYAPCLVDLEIHMNGEVTRERMNVLSFEEYLELLD